MSEHSTPPHPLFTRYVAFAERRNGALLLALLALMGVALAFALRLELHTDVAELLYASQRPLSLSAGNAPSGAPAWRNIPSWYVLGTSDKIITPDAQQMMAERAKSTITRVDAGHLSMISHPDAVVDVIRQAASEAF